MTVKGAGATGETTKKNLTPKGKKKQISTPEPKNLAQTEKVTPSGNMRSSRRNSTNVDPPSNVAEKKGKLLSEPQSKNAVETSHNSKGLQDSTSEKPVTSTTEANQPKPEKRNRRRNKRKSGTANAEATLEKETTSMQRDSSVSVNVKASNKKRKTEVQNDSTATVDDKLKTPSDKKTTKRKLEEQNDSRINEDLKAPSEKKIAVQLESTETLDDILNTSSDKKKKSRRRKKQPLPFSLVNVDLKAPAKKQQPLASSLVNVDLKAPAKKQQPLASSLVNVDLKAPAKKRRRQRQRSRKGGLPNNSAEKLPISKSEKSDEQKEPENTNCAYLANLNTSVDEEGIRSFFKENDLESVQEIVLVKDPNGKSLGLATVKFHNEEDLKSVFKLVGKDVSGQPLRVYKSFKRFRSLCHQKRVEEGKMGVKIENGTEGSGA